VPTQAQGTPCNPFSTTIDNGGDGDATSTDGGDGDSNGDGSDGDSSSALRQPLAPIRRTASQGPRHYRLKAVALCFLLFD
jgi:hypothetical protein